MATAPLSWQQKKFMKNIGFLVAWTFGKKKSKFDAF